MLIQAENLIPEKNIVIFSPHFDDVLFFLGGYIEELKKTEAFEKKSFHVHLLFSRTNYQANDASGNKQTDLKRIQFASGIRLQEDMNCLDEILGEDNYGYELHGYRECFARGKAFADSEMEFPHGMYEDFDENDHDLFCRMQTLISKCLQDEDTALIFPCAIKEHIDHFILREAAVTANAETASAKAAVYFIEDKPYGGLATEEELTRLENFIKVHDLKALPFAYDPAIMIDLAFKHYPSQVEECYKDGVFNRAKNLAQELNENVPGVDRLFSLKKKV